MKNSTIQLSCFLFTLIFASGIKLNDHRTLSALEQCYCLRQTVGGLHSPVAAIFYQEDSHERVLMVEQWGLVLKMTRGGNLLETFMDIRDRVVTSNEYGESRGLLSVVLDPYYDTRKKVYAYYIRKEDLEDYAYISMFNAEDGHVDPQSEIYLFRIHQPFQGGNGGPMFFGDDGYLYIVTGDGGEKDDPKGNAQNKNSFHGKVLRIDVTSGRQDFTERDSGTAKLYGIPRTNPFINDSVARPELFALGVRNMWGCSQDSVKKTNGTGRIFCAETGTNKFDEINVIQSGKNYGWNVRQGTSCQMKNEAECRPLENEKFPIYEFPHSKSHALVGGYVYRGQKLTPLHGVYTFADAVTGKTYLLKEKGLDKWEKSEWLQCDVNQCPFDAREKPLKHILAFGQDFESELYVLMSDEFLTRSDKGKMFAFLPFKSSRSKMLNGQCIILAVLIGISRELIDN